MFSKRGETKKKNLKDLELVTESILRYIKLHYIVSRSF